MAVKKEHIQTEYTLCKDIEDIYPYQLVLPNPPLPQNIINYGLPKEEQIFRRTIVPKEILRLNTLPREEAIAEAELNPEYMRFIELMWYKFTYGEWQYINGKALHISPTYWFYLNFWKLDSGLPKFRYDLTHFTTELWEFAWWDYMVQPSDVCFGEIQATMRKVGKTYRAMCKAYKRIISKRHAMGCIQSKTDDDAKDAFSVKMVTPVLSIPFFFKPFQANSIMPKGEGFRFMPRSGKSDKEKSLNPDDFLFSSIEYRSSGETAADGPKWYVHITDEDGKAPDIDVWERHRVVIPALTEDEMIYGKELTTTTVEEMVKGGGMLFWYKWKMSDRNPNKEKKDLTVDERGKTSSGLWPWFCPARCCVVWDKFGCAIIDDPTEEQQKWLKEVKKDPQYKIGGRERIRRKIDSLKTQNDKHSEMRKFPENVRDMFLSASGRCYFDLGILNERLKYFAYGYPKEMATDMTFGNFQWKDGVFGEEVVFTPTTQEDAKFWISYMPRPDHQNKWRVDDWTGKKIPMNWHKFCAGADAFKFDTEDVINKSEMSKGSMHIYAEYDVNIDRPDTSPDKYVTDDICLEYLWREDTMTVDDLCEDYLKACIFYGCKLFPEKNNPEVVSYFKRHGFEHYLQFDMQFKSSDGAVFLQEKGGAGANTDTKSIQSMFKVVQRYVKEKGMRCKFYRTMEQLKHVSPDNMNPYDLFVSLATCLRVVQEFNPIRLKEDESPAEIKDLIGFFSAGLPTDESDSSASLYGTDNGSSW